MVSSVNGKITKGDDPEVRSWSSGEDQALFDRIRERASCIIMGRKTYEAAKPRLRLTPKTLRIVMTKTPNAYKGESVARQLEFTDESPRALATRLEAAGIDEAFLLGGGQTNMEFVKAGLVGEIRLTIEPHLFGKGKDIIGEFDGFATLRLTHVEKLNNQGTLYCRYTVLGTL